MKITMNVEKKEIASTKGAVLSMVMAMIQEGMVPAEDVEKVLGKLDVMMSRKAGKKEVKLNEAVAVRVYDDEEGGMTLEYDIKPEFIADMNSVIAKNAAPYVKFLMALKSTAEAFMSFSKGISDDIVKVTAKYAPKKAKKAEDKAETAA